MWRNLGPVRESCKRIGGESNRKSHRSLLSLWLPQTARAGEKLSCLTGGGACDDSHIPVSVFVTGGCHCCSCHSRRNRLQRVVAFKYVNNSTSRKLRLAYFVRLPPPQKLASVWMSSRSPRPASALDLARWPERSRSSQAWKKSRFRFRCRSCRGDGRWRSTTRGFRRPFHPAAPARGVCRIRPEK